jgi:uncharacterized membrane protein (DUF485 family)
MNLKYEQYSKLTQTLKEEYDFLQKQKTQSWLFFGFVVATTYMVMSLLITQLPIGQQLITDTIYGSIGTVTLAICFAFGADVIGIIIRLSKWYNFKKRAKSICPQAFKK